MLREDVSPGIFELRTLYNSQFYQFNPVLFILFSEIVCGTQTNVSLHCFNPHGFDLLKKTISWFYYLLAGTQHLVSKFVDFETVRFSNSSSFLRQRFARFQKCVKIVHSWQRNRRTWKMQMKINSRQYIHSIYIITPHFTKFYRLKGSTSHKTFLPVSSTRPMLTFQTCTSQIDYSK